MEKADEKRNYFGCLIPMYRGTVPGDAVYLWNDEMGLVVLMDDEMPEGPVQIIKVNGQISKELLGVQNLVDKIVLQTVTHKKPNNNLLFRDFQTLSEAIEFLNGFAIKLGYHE